MEKRGRFPGGNNLLIDYYDSYLEKIFFRLISTSVPITTTLSPYFQTLRDGSYDLEIFFNHKKTGPIEEKLYIQTEQKFVDVCNQLWSISPVVMYSDINDPDHDIEYLTKKLLAEEKELSRKPQKKFSEPRYDFGFLFSDRYEEINLINRLTLRDYLHTCFIFQDEKVALWSNSIAYLVYCEESFKDSLKLICTTHGLYFR
ncbi:hypothetical protein [Brevibacillus daliensis]|uniref:hypothetical protein n=1 Tax=Brevibacillus daliensis TaxID=2892995 RepID=UPI001E42A8DE|nr:hypothetical protein [Brevibacillus daliensis]